MTVHITRLGALGALIFGTAAVNPLPPIDTFNINYTPMQFGCKGDGVADDTGCLQKAINAMANSRLEIDGEHIYRFTSTLNVGRMTLHGNYRGDGQFMSDPHSPCASGLRVGAANLSPAINITASGAEVSNLCVDNAGVNNTAGSTFSVGALSNVSIHDSQVNGGCISLDISGTSSVTNVGNYIQNNTIVPVDYVGCIGIRVGHNSQNGYTTDTHLTDDHVFCPNPGTGALNTIGMQFEDAGGPVVARNDIVACFVGTKIYPAANQVVNGGFFNGTVFGDSSHANDLLIDTAASSGDVNSLAFTGDWASSAYSGPSVLLQNRGGGTIFGVHFDGARIYPRVDNNEPALTAVDALGRMANITVDNSTLCARATETSGYMVNFHIGGSVALRDSTIGACDRNLAITVAGGVNFDPPGAGVFTMTGNQILAAATPLNYAPGATSRAVIQGNNGVDNSSPTVASATTITAPVNPVFFVSGSSTIRTINRGWAGRIMTMIPIGGAVLSSGGNIYVNGTYTTAANTPITFVFDGTHWRFK